MDENGLNCDIRRKPTVNGGESVSNLGESNRGVLIGLHLVHIHLQNCSCVSFINASVKFALIPFLCRSPDGVLRGGAALHPGADRPPAAPASLRHDQASDPARAGVPGEAGLGPPPALKL